MLNGSIVEEERRGPRNREKRDTRKTSRRLEPSTSHDKARRSTANCHLVKQVKSKVNETAAKNRGSCSSSENNISTVREYREIDGKISNTWLIQEAIRQRRKREAGEVERTPESDAVVPNLT